MRKLLLSIAAGLFLFAGAYNYAKAEECTSGVSITSVQSQLGSAGDEARLVDITPPQLLNLVERSGVPPKTNPDQPYEAKMVVIGEFAILYVFQNGCATASMGPIPLERLLGLLGVVNANG